MYAIPPLICQKLIWIPTRLLLKFFGHLEISGLEQLKGMKGNVIFAMNHSGEIDPFMVPASLPFWSRFSPLFYITREKSFYDVNGWRQHLFGGWFITMWGGYTAYAGLRDYAKSLAQHVAIARDGHSFCVFPEGGISPDGAIQPGKGGFGYLAYATKLPIVPVHTIGSHGLTVKNFFLRRGKLRIIFGQPIPALDRDVSTASVDDFKAYSNFVMDKVGELK